MAITVDQIKQVWAGEGDEDSKAKTLSELIAEDTESQLTAIKVNREDIKKEKTEEIAKRHAAEEQLKKEQEVNAKLQKQLEDSSEENVKKIWEQRLQDAANISAQKQSELQSTIDEQKKRIESLEIDQKMLKCSEEFSKAIQGKNIAPDSLEDLKMYVLGENCHKFDLKPTGEGNVYATKDGLTIKQVTEQACNSTFGKNCILINSTGGGAEGGSSKVNSKDNPFITGNITEQMRLFKENPQEYQRLKQAAGK